MKVAPLIKGWHLLLILLFFFGCASTKEEGHDHGKDMPQVSVPKDYVYPMAEINFKQLTKENRGMQILLENATTVNDFYRGAVQEKELGETRLQSAKWEEARIHLEKSNQFLRVVLNYLPDDEAQRNIYGSHKVIFMPNLLMADNDLKLLAIDRKIGKADEAVESEKAGRRYLSKSLGDVKTEWAFQVQKEFDALGK